MLDKRWVVVLKAAKREGENSFPASKGRSSTGGGVEPEEDRHVPVIFHSCGSNKELKT
jgi:hypothetical protein